MAKSIPVIGETRNTDVEGVQLQARVYRGKWAIFSNGGQPNSFKTRMLSGATTEARAWEQYESNKWFYEYYGASAGASGENMTPTIVHA